MTYRPYNSEGDFYFVTATVSNWIALFEREEYRKIIFGSLRWLRQKNLMYLFAFVVMADHVHLLLRPRKISISLLMQKFGSFTAHTILAELRRNDESAWLAEFRKAAEPAGLVRHKIWQRIQAANVYSDRFLKQKMDYIHDNPVRKRLVQRAEEYPYSSAAFYAGGEAIIPVDDVSRFW